MKNFRGTSLYPGIDVTLDEMKKHLAEAHEAGINAVFTSLQLPESDPEILMHDFPLMCEEAHKYKMMVVADIAKRTGERFGIDRHNPKEVKALGVDVMRLDGDFTEEEIAKLTHNKDGVMMMLNASIAEYKLQKICEFGINKENVLFCHNFYPMRYTGLPADQVISINDLLHRYGFRVGGFLAGKHHLRLGCSIGLPTLECMRNADLSYALQAMLQFGFDDLFFGDDLASLEEMKALVNAEKPMTFRMRLLVDDENLKEWLHGRQLKQLQGNLPEIVRSHFEYQDSMYPGNCEIGLAGPRQRGTVMLAKKSLCRYEGEIQIARKDLPDDPDIGIIGQIIEEDLPLVDIFKVNPGVMYPRFRFLIVD